MYGKGVSRSINCLVSSVAAWQFKVYAEPVIAITADKIIETVLTVFWGIIFKISLFINTSGYKRFNYFRTFLLIAI